MGVGGGWGRPLLHMSLQIGTMLCLKKKKGKKTAANETRRKAAGEGLVGGEESLVGGLPAHLSAGLPAAPHPRKCSHKQADAADLLSPTNGD